MSDLEQSNHMNAVFLSNEVLPMYVEKDDRRMLVIWPEEKMYAELQKGVDVELANNGAEAFYGYLLSVDMMWQGELFGPHTKPPMTEAKRRLIDHGLASWEVFFEEWESGELTHNDKPVPFCACIAFDLFRIFDAWAHRRKETSLGAHKFQSFIGTKIKKRRDMDYQIGTNIKKATFFLPDRPKDASSEKLTQREYLGGCVLEFSRLFAGEL
jgi:putative DNA primase/helicase